MEGGAVIHALDADHCAATWASTFVQIWRGEVHEQTVIEGNRIAQDFVDKHPTPVHALIIIEATSAFPGAAARAQYARFSRDIVSRMSLAVAVTEHGGGFRAAAIRSVGVALTVLLPHKLPFKFVESVDQAVDRLGPYVPSERGGAEGLRRAVLDLRAHIAVEPTCRAV